MQFNVVEGSGGIPPEPDWKTAFKSKPERAAASADWARVIREMREANTLAVANGHAIRRLVEFRIAYDKAAKEVARDGPVVKDANNLATTGVWNPWWSIMRQADDSIRTLESELGLTPRHRDKAGKVKRKAGPTRAADRFLKAIPAG
jgi:P27 family predicted phage terminase small subunit